MMMTETRTQGSVCNSEVSRPNATAASSVASSHVSVDNAPVSVAVIVAETDKR